MLFYRVQNVSGAHPASYPMGTTHLHLVPRSKNEWNYTSTPQYALMAWCSVRNHRQLHFSQCYYFQK